MPVRTSDLCAVRAVNITSANTRARYVAGTCAVHGASTDRRTFDCAPLAYAKVASAHARASQARLNASRHVALRQAVAASAAARAASELAMRETVTFKLTVVTRSLLAGLTVVATEITGAPAARITTARLTVACAFSAVTNIRIGPAADGDWTARCNGEKNHSENAHAPASSTARAEPATSISLVRATRRCSRRDQRLRAPPSNSLCSCKRSFQLAPNGHTNAHADLWRAQRPTSSGAQRRYVG